MSVVVKLRKSRAELYNILSEISSGPPSSNEEFIERTKQNIMAVETELQDLNEPLVDRQHNQ